MHVHVFLMSRNKESAFFLSLFLVGLLSFLYTAEGETSKGHSGWVSDPGENSLH